MPVFAAPQGVRIYAVGDIHGRADLLRRLLALIQQDAADCNKRVIEVFLGDYIDRGLESDKVIDLLIAPPPCNHERICLRGNHEATLLEFLQDPNVLRGWSQFGGYATLSAYGIPIPTEMNNDTFVSIQQQLRKTLPIEHLKFFDSLPLSYQCGDYFFVHAGIRPGIPLDEQREEDFLWIRDEFLRYTHPHEAYIVHGHTPNTEPELLANRANLDVCNAPTDQLACLVIDGQQRRILLT